MMLTVQSSVDLQLHTVYSDGDWTPEVLIEQLLQAGFAVAAVTDHDRVDTVLSLQQTARDRGLLLLPAVEMSAHWRDEPVDVLCYGFDPKAGPLRLLAEELLRHQQDNIRQTVRSIAQQGCALSEDEVQKIVEEPSVRQPHSLVRLMKHYGYGTVEHSAGRILVDAGLQIVTLEIGAVAAAVHESGGVCLIAHPGRGEGYVQFDEPLLDQLRAEVAIDGLEAYYPLHSLEQTAMYRRYAGKHDLFVSAGSDSHGPDRPPIRYPAALSGKLLEHLGVQVLPA